MTDEKKQIIANEIDKYFRSRIIDCAWFSRHLKPDIEMPDDGFEPQNMSYIKIDEESIKQLGDDLYGFSGSSKVLFKDKASTIGTSINVEFGGQAITITADDRTWVKNVLLTRFHRMSDILPNE